MPMYMVGMQWIQVSGEYLRRRVRIQKSLGWKMNAGSKARYFFMPELSGCPGCDSNVSVLLVNVGFPFASSSLLHYSFIIRNSIRSRDI